MIEDISGITPKVVMAALDGLLLQHQVTAHNIANVSTPNYTAKTVSFEQHLNRLSVAASNPSERNALTEQVNALAHLMEDKASLITSTGKSVELDKEMVDLTANVLKYRVLLEANGMRVEILAMDIKGRGR
jgi:flagellar basal-body rod protein FlgB